MSEKKRILPSDAISPPKRQKCEGQDDLIKGARRLVSRLARDCQKKDGFGCFSVSLYDTAWLSMVIKVDASGSRQWLFPDSFTYLLRTQGEDGSWERYASPVDGILMTMAGLLSVVRHDNSTIKTSVIVATTAAGDGDDHKDYALRISKATAALASALNEWDVNATKHVGFEILVPSLLHELAQTGIEFDFPGKTDLMLLNTQKLSKFKPELVTSEMQTTLLHSLEGLVGKVDFDQLAHHCTSYGGMLGSPAATAAYLMYAKTWDVRAEQYLTKVVQSYGSSGAVPSGFPTPIFEISWIISTLLTNGYALTDFSEDDIQVITGYLRQILENQGGQVGFAPGLLPDADDTARALLAMAHLGRPTDTSSLIQSFEASTHFTTYQLERDPSTSTNCNVLLALLNNPWPEEHARQIEKTANFLHSRWEDGALQDKWNLAPEYTEMLLAYAFSQLMKILDCNWLDSDSLLRTFIAERVPIVLCQLLSRTLVRQSENGSWDSSAEKTAYSVLLISHTLALPWPKPVRQYAEDSLRKGKDYLQRHMDQWTEGSYIWIEKVTYKLPSLAETYCLAAMKASHNEPGSWAPDIYQIFAMEEKSVKKMSKFFGHLPLFRSTLESTMVLAIMEAKLYTQLLKAARLGVFPRDNMAMSEDKYLDYIPITWTGANAAGGFPLSAKTIWDMMVISMLNYQADEYMESVVVHLSEQNLQQLGTIIAFECFNGLSTSEAYSSSPTWHSLQPDRRSLSPLTPPLLESTDKSTTGHTLGYIASVITKYINHVRRHLAVLRAPVSAQKRVAEELQKYLLAQIAHNADNVRMRNQKDKEKQSASTGIPYDDGDHAKGISSSYYDWVHTTGANDTSCPYSFNFFCCLISKRGINCLSSAKQSYLGRELALHLATMCRQYNDYGSYSRDSAEGNLNSLDFPEFRNRVDRDLETPLEPYPPVITSHPFELSKKALMEIAEFERSCMELCFVQLSAGLSAATSTEIKAFINVTDLFGQIYAARDIASKVQK